MIKTGIMSSAYFDIDDYAEGLKKVKLHGYDCIDYQQIASPFSSLFDYSDEEFEAYFKNLGACAKENGIEIYQMHGLWPRYADGDPNGVDKDLGLYIRQLQAGYYMGCKRFVLHPCLPYGWGEEPIKEKAFEETLNTISNLLPYAKRFGIIICLENLPHKKSHSFSDINELKKVIRTVDSKFVKACLDTGHSHCTGEDIYECIKTLDSDLEALHVHDASCGQDRHLIPFQGEVDWSKFIQGLKEIRFNGCISLETEISKNTPSPICEELQVSLSKIARWMANEIE